MDYENKVLLFHCLEWLCFWWDNQTECLSCGQDEMIEPQEFAQHWWSMEKDAYPGADECDTVNYSAAVFCQDITGSDVEIDERFTKSLDEQIEYDKKYFAEISGKSYEEFMPTWW